MEALRIEDAVRPDAEPWQVVFAAPAFDLEPLPSAEIDALFRGGEPEADVCERLLASAARARGALDVELAEGLAALRQGDRLAQLGCHLDDHAREVLDLGKRAADGLAALGRGLRTRPLLREALRSGRARLRGAETVLPVAVGEREAEWVERAARCTVRELEAAVRRARTGAPEPEEDWVRLGVHLRPEERLVLDAGLELAGEVLPGSSRMDRLEAMAQELLGSAPGDADGTTLGRGVPVSPPALPPRRLPARLRPGARRADVVPGREGVARAGGGPVIAARDGSLRGPSPPALASAPAAWRGTRRCPPPRPGPSSRGPSRRR